MREIKFRGKHYYLTGVWVYGDLVRHACAPGYVFIGTKNDGTIRVIPETVGQFTGLHDKNGREIYEGDIVKGLHWGGLDYGSKLCMVEFKDGCFVENYFGSLVGSAENNQNLEIIGNIHENPELLEGK